MKEEDKTKIKQFIKDNVKFSCILEDAYDKYNKNKSTKKQLIEQFIRDTECHELLISYVLECEKDMKNLFRKELNKLTSEEILLKYIELGDDL